MPLSKTQRDHKEDTWRPEELEKSLRGIEKDGNSQSKVRAREHRGVSKEQHADDGRAAHADDVARESRGERQKARRPLDPNGAEDDGAAADGERRHHRSSRARDAGDPPPGADHRADAEKRDGRRRAEVIDDKPGAERDEGRHQSRRSKATDGGAPGDDDDRRRKHRDGVPADQESDRPRHRRDGEPKNREESEVGDDEERRRRHEERRRRQRDGGGTAAEDEHRRRGREDGARGEGGDDGQRRRRNDGDAADKGAGHRDDEEDDEERRRRREERRRHRDAGGGGGGGGGDDRRRAAAGRGVENGGDEEEPAAHARHRDGEHRDDERRRRRHEASAAELEAASAARGGGERSRPERGSKQREEGEEEHARERHKRRTEGGDDDGATGERDRERRRRTDDDDGTAKRDKHSRRPRDEAGDEADQRSREKEERRHREERGGDDRDRRRRREEEQQQQHEERDDRRRDDRHHRRKKERQGDEDWDGDPKRTDDQRGGGGEQEARHERRRDELQPQDKEHRRRRDDADAAEADNRTKAAGSKGEKAKEQSSTKALDGKPLNRSSTDEVFRSRRSQLTEAADAVDDEAIEARLIRNQDVPVLKMGAAKTKHDEYDEDFEEYDEDFEEAEEDGSDAKESGSKIGNLSNREVDDLFEAMNRENDRLLAESRNSSSRDSKRGDTRAETHERAGARPTTSKPRAFINFVSAKQREMNMQVSSRARKRGKELLQIIELDSVYVDLFEMAPVKEYELYMRSFGRTNSRQAYVQTNADSIEREIQTEEVECDTKWTQQPADDAGLCCGGTNSSGTSKKVDSSDDAASLLGFLQRTSKVVEVLLDEDRPASASQHSGGGQRSAAAAAKYSFSDGFVSLGVDSVSVLKGRAVTTCCFSPSQPSMLLTGHSLPQAADGGSGDRLTADGGPAAPALTSAGLVCLWNVNTPQRPVKLLAAAEQPTCCCFGPLKATLVFAGMQDGSVVAWDLRGGSGSAASGVPPSSSLPPILYPAYCTAAVLQREGHGSAIAALLPVLADGRSSRAATQSTAVADRDGSGAGLSFQLASLEQSGVVNMWVVAEVSQELSTLGTERAAADGGSGGSSSSGGGGGLLDFGLAPGARVKLLRSSTVKLVADAVAAASATPKAAAAAAAAPAARSIAQPGGESLQATAMQLDPSNSARFFVGTDVGLVLHGLRYGGSGVKPGSGQRRRTYCASRPASGGGDAAAAGTATASACTAPVTAMDVSPFMPATGARTSSSSQSPADGAATAAFASASASLLLVGCADGSLRLHTPLQEAPAVTLPPPAQQQPAPSGPGAAAAAVSLRHAQWSRSCPGVILALDESSVMHTWDLTKSDSVPIKSDVLAVGTKRAFTFALSEAESAAARPRLALCFTDGTVEVHTLASHVGTGKPGDVEQLLKYIDSL